MVSTLSARVLKIRLRADTTYGSVLRKVELKRTA
jgi:hypothetical protein